MLISVQDFEHKGKVYELDLVYTFQAGDFTTVPFKDVEIDQGWEQDSTEEISEALKNEILDECFDALLEACDEEYMEACSQEGY